MRVALETSGGQAAAINLRLPPRVLDTDRMPPEQARELRGLVAAASTESGGAGTARDAMTYTITVDDGAATLIGDDATMSPAFGALVSWIERHAGR